VQGAQGSQGTQGTQGSQGAQGAQGVVTIFARKTTGQDVTNSAAFVNDTDLLFAVAANEVWDFEIQGFAILSTGATGGIAVRVTGPAGSTVIYSSDEQYFSAAALATAGVAYEDQTTGISLYADNLDRPVRLRGIIINGSTAGNCRLQWAQAVATPVVTTTLKAGSFMRAFKGA
jgi:hypothetical protein